jgi:flagellar biosynthesis protein FlhA
MEDILRDKIQKGEYGTHLALEPGLAQKILTSVNQALDKIAQLNYQPVILCSPVLRRHVKRLLERFLPQVAVLSHSELTSETKIQSLGTVTFS